MVKEDLIKKLSGDLSAYTSLPFWSWNNEVEIPELLNQIGIFKSLGIDGFIIHARTGLKTEYLGEKWFACIEACLKEAKRLDMQVWIYDENGWPSGFVEGKLLEKESNRVQYLEYQNGEVKILTSASFADILNPDVTEQFIERTHEEYFRRFQDSFGHELAGFFTDEPQYYRWGTPYSRILPGEYQKEYGESLENKLHLLFVEDEGFETFRYRYYSLLNKLYTRNFYKKIYDWCEEHHCMLTGHSVEENFLYGQMWCSAGVMPSYEFEHMPGIDWLGRWVETSVSGPKQVGSVAQQLSKKQVLTETFGCSGWDTTPRELRRIAEFQYSLGVNTLCQHLCSYSLKGQGKNDYPPSFSKQNHWWKYSGTFNEYFKRLTYLLANTQECSDTLVIHPIRAAFLTYEREKDRDSIARIEENFRILNETLIARGVQFHYGDETILARHARVEGNAISVGSCSYTRVILPDMDNIDQSTLTLLEQFVAAGGKLCLYGEPPHYINGVENSVALKANCSFEEISGVMRTNCKEQPLIAAYRRGECGDFLYVVNTSRDQTVRVYPNGKYSLLDLQNLSVSEKAESMIVYPMESAILMLDETFTGLEVIEIAEPFETDVTKAFALTATSDNNLTVDYVSISKNGVDFGAPEFIHKANERLILENYQGRLWLKYHFTVKNIPKKARLLAEQMKYITTQCNGLTIDLKQSDWDVYFCEADIAPYLREGVNEFVACIDYYQRPSVRRILYDPDVQESFKNCVIIDTEIESIYIQGDFCVNGDREMIDVIVPNTINQLQLCGYPNFAGEITIEGEVDILDDRAVLQLNGRYMVASVQINGANAGQMILTNRLDLSPYIRKGKNAIKISLISSMRNMMGPHHVRSAAEPDGVGPHCFHFRGWWNEFTDEYRLVQFGIESVKLLFEKIDKKEDKICQRQW